MKTFLNVLNLEDNTDDAELNRVMLSARWPHCQLTRVDRSEDFMRALGEGGFDLILSDFTMPGFGGQRALAMAREFCPQIPFLFVSGTIGEDTAIEAMKNGATDYVLKHRLVRLIPAVDRALREVAEREERERAEKAMRESEHKYRELFECLAEAAFLADEQTGRIIDANRRAEQMLGCSRQEILGRNQQQFLALDKLIADGGALRLCHLLRADGSTMLVDLRTTHLTLHGRELVLRLCYELT